MATNTWGTPQYVFDYLNEAFGPFTLDAAADADNHKCDLWWSEELSGLDTKHLWSTGYRTRVFINPPYDDIAPWVERAARETLDRTVESVTLLLPVRTDQKWWHDTVLPFACAVYFIRGRIAFVREGKTNCSFEPSMVVRFCAGFTKMAPTFSSIEIPKQGKLPWRVKHLTSVTGPESQPRTTAPR